MQEAISQFSIEFRERIIKVIKEDFFLKNNAPRVDRIVLSEKYKSLIDNINGFIVISNYTSGLYEYISDGVKSNLGYDLRDYSNEALTDFMISIIQDDHRNYMVNSILPNVLNYLKNNSTNVTGTDYRYTCCLKLKDIYNKYHWYLVDTVLVEVDAEGFPVRTMITCTNIGQFKKDECVYFNIMKKNQDGVYEVMLEGSDNQINDIKLTPREVQIINLISGGNTNKEIAEKLFISLNTVQTHRKSILKKTKCNGTAELTSFAFSRGLL
jgi:DNA-binding CsgD family transcriptional regulator